MPGQLAEEHADMLRRITDDLAARHHGVVSHEDVEHVVHDTYDQLASAAKVRAYLPLLTRHAAEEALVDLAHERQDSGRAVPKVVFMCVHNAGRSQLAAALLDHYAQGRVDVRATGTQPTGELNPVAVQSLKEIGIELEEPFPEPVTDEVLRAADVVVNMGCGAERPVIPGVRYVDWDLPDPAGLPIEQVRPLRDELSRRVRALIDDLTG